MNPNCIDCGISRDYVEFVKKRNICKKCYNIYMKDYRKRTNRKSDKKYYENNKEYYEEYRNSNKDKSKEYYSEYYEKNKEKKNKTSYRKRKRT